MNKHPTNLAQPSHDLATLVYRGNTQNFSIKDADNILADENGWVQYTWHHHEDGKTMFPIPTKINNGSAGGFSHSGGKSILNKKREKLIGFFDSPFN